MSTYKTVSELVEQAFQTGYTDGVKSAFEIVEEVLEVHAEHWTLCRHIKARLINELEMEE